MTILAKLGLMKMSEHERIVAELTEDLRLTDETVVMRNKTIDYLGAELATRLKVLEASRKDIANLVAGSARLQLIIDSQEVDLSGYREHVAALTPDAEKWRASLKRGRERRGGKAK